MGAPSSISLDPSSGPVGTTVTITATDLFERPSYTSRELFTKSGSDAPAGDWVGGVTQLDGIIGYGAKFYSSSDYVQLPPISYTTTLSVCFWFNSAGVIGSIIGELVDFGHPTGVSPMDIFLREDNRKIQVNCHGPSGDGSNRKVSQSSSTIDDNQWHHLAVTINTSIQSNTIKVYIDGIEESVVLENDLFTSLYPNGDSIIVGNSYEAGSITGYYFNGTICGLYISNTEWTQSDIDKLSNLPTIEQDLTDITPTRYISETQCQVEIV